MIPIGSYFQLKPVGMLIPTSISSTIDYAFMVFTMKGLNSLVILKVIVVLCLTKYITLELKLCMIIF